MLQSVLETTIVEVAVRISLYSFPFALSINETAFVDLSESFARSRPPGIHPLSMLHTVDPFTCELITIYVCLCTMTFLHIVYPLPFVDLTFDVFVDSIAISHVVSHVSSIDDTRAIPNGAFSLTLAVSISLPIPILVMLFRKDRHILRYVVELSNCLVARDHH